MDCDLRLQVAAELRHVHAERPDKIIHKYNNYMDTSLSLSIYIYIYMEREREIEIEIE